MLRSLSSSLLVLILVAGCATGRNAVHKPAEVPAPSAVSAPDAAVPTQPLVYDVTPPVSFQTAVATGTRTRTGRPGPDYWQQDVAYDLTARVFPEEKRVEGSGTIRYTNNAPHALAQLHLELAQNLHAEGVIRFEAAEVTGGIELSRVAVEGAELEPGAGGPSYSVDGTQLAIVPEDPVGPGETVTLEIDWSFVVPQQGASGRMGYSGDDLLYIGYWYPIMSVYDDVDGWYTDPFTGNAEFYADHGDYEVTIEAPAGWLVMSTGELLNADEVLAPEVLERMRRAHDSGRRRRSPAVAVSS